MLKDKSLYKIVLTGGPCAGKTTALTRLEESLVEKGFHVFIVGESATELIKGGARKKDKNAIDMVDYQKLYTLLFNSITDAITLIDELDVKAARELLVAAQQNAEIMYIEAK